MFDLGDLEIDTALKRQWRIGRAHGAPAKVLQSGEHGQRGGSISRCERVPFMDDLVDGRSKLKSRFPPNPLAR
jgi:hypothetical protein